MLRKFLATAVVVCAIGGSATASQPKWWFWQPKETKVEELVPETIPQALIGDLMSDLDLEEFQAAAIAGNLAQETGNFTMLHQIRGPGLGYSQWSGSRKTKFRKFAGDNTLSYESNYGFLIHELTGEYAYVLVKIRETTTTEAATEVFMKQFLRPNPRHAAFGKRVSYASTYLAGDFDGAGCLEGYHKGGGRLESC